MNVNQKGDIGVVKVIADLTAKGYVCFLPMSGSCAVDLVVANPTMELRRLQVKYRNLENGTIVVGLNTVINGIKVPIDSDKIDGWAIYCPETDEVYYVAKSDIICSRSRFTLRVREAKQNQPKAAPHCQEFRNEQRLWIWNDSICNDSL